MNESHKPNTVYRLRPVEILPGVYYKITRQEGAEITLEVVPTDNRVIAKRLARLRYPELCAAMQVIIEALCDTLGEEVCIGDDFEQTKKACVELSRALVCLQGAYVHFSSLDALTRLDISSHEKSRRPIQDEQA